ncbi:MAG: MarR family winged helix-turn-helix transcriptional regulator [Actinomycetota bacterium]
MDGVPPQVEVGIGLGVVSQLFQTRVAEVLGPAGATYTQLSVLSHLVRHAEQHSIGDLAAAMQINQPGITKVVRRLEEDGLVTVVGHPDDRRRRLAAVTEAGVERFGELMSLLTEELSAWFDDWTESELRGFADFIWRLGGRLDQDRSNDDHGIGEAGS